MPRPRSVLGENPIQRGDQALGIALIFAGLYLRDRQAGGYRVESIGATP